MNIRPNGPCYNTHVDIEQVRQEITRMLIDESPEQSEDANG